MNVLLLGGSPSAPSSSWRLLQLVGARLAAQGQHAVALQVHALQVHALQVRDLPALALLRADIDDPAIAVAAAMVAEADAVVIGTPVYKAAYSGLLKTFLDLLPQDGLAGKIVLPLATGGSQSHMLALDYALRPVLASLSPRHILPSLYATSDQLPWHPEHGLNPVPSIATRIDAAVEQLEHALHALPRAPAVVDSRIAPAALAA